MNLKEVIDELLRDHDFGEPWRLSQENIGIVVPIQRKANIPKARGYLVLEEVGDKVTIEDSGSIDKVKVRVDADRPVFIRGGGVLKGQGTQSRAVQFGVVVLPQEQQLVPVLCVHASHPIGTGRKFSVQGYAPRKVSMGLMARSQNHTWSAVSNFSAMASADLRATGVAERVAPDDLVRTMETVERFKTDVEEALKKIPGDLENQVGVAIFDQLGVVGVEVFDHPGSWRALSRSVMRQYKDVIVDQKVPDYLSVDMDRVLGSITSFLGKAEKSEESEVHKSERSCTTLIKGEVVGEYTTLGQKTIHLLLARKEPQSEHHPLRLPGIPRGSRDLPMLRGFRRAAPPSEPAESQPVYATAGPIAPERFLQHRWGYKFLKNLEKEPKTFSDLSSGFKSTATLSKRAKEATSLGLVEKALRLENGREVYKLTETGQQLLRKSRSLCAQ